MFMIGEGWMAFPQLLLFQKASAKIYKSFELTKEYDKKSQNRHNNPHQKNIWQG